MITPWLHLYNKSRAIAADGRKFLGRFQAFNYKHTIDAMGWFDTVKCEIKLPEKTSGEFLLNYLGNEVMVYVDNPNRPIWEGFINRITLKRNGIITTRSLDSMSNAIEIIYDDPASAPQQSRSTVVTDDDSRAIYGTKSGTFEAGTNRGSQTLTTGIGDKKLAQLAWPSFSSALDVSGGLSLEIECLGFYHTLKWEKFAVSSTTVEAVGLVIQRYLYSTVTPTYVGYNGSGGSGNGDGLFYNDTDDSLWNANTSYNAVRENQTSTTWDHIVKMCEAGDGTDDWLVGITPYDISRDYRRAYYRQANNNIEYVVSLREGMKVRSVYGHIIEPWEVIPDRSIRVGDLSTDVRIESSTQSDPSTMWIKKISYDANSNTVTWQGKDDITIEGIFGFKDITKDIGNKFANQRTVYV